MRLATRLTLIMMLGVAAVLSVQAILHVRRVLSLHGREMRDDLAILGRTLGAAVGEIYKTSGKKAALAHVERADSKRERTRISLIHSRDAALPKDLQRELSRSKGNVVSRAGDKRLVAYVAVDTGGEEPAYLKLIRARTDEREYIERVFWTQIATTMLLVIVATALAMLLGLRLVGRRVESLIGQARRVAEGDFRPNDDPRSDELGLLAQEMNQMTRSLETAQRKAREERHARTALLEQLRHSDRLSTIGKLSSSIAHELGTPLNVVAGRAAMIASGEVVGDEAVASARVIAQQAQQMTQIIRQLLDFSRGRGVQKESTRIASIIEQAVTLMEPLADKHGIVIECSVIESVEAAVDRGKVLQVLTNLMMNGIQAMPDGGTLSIGARRVHIQEPGDIHATQGHYVCIEVKDQGVGIASEAVQKIFQPFFTTKGEGEGTGLGLPVCDGIVREHGGWISVDSDVGRGSCFFVFLPQVDNP